MIKVANGKYIAEPWYRHQDPEARGIFPLDWKIDHDPEGEWNGRARPIAIASGKAHARLITAAPDLMIAAQAVLGEFMNDDNWACLGTGSCEKDGGYTCQQCVVEKLRELLHPAIRKAVGE